MVGVFQRFFDDFGHHGIFVLAHASAAEVTWELLLLVELMVDSRFRIVNRSWLWLCCWSWMSSRTSWVNIIHVRPSNELLLLLLISLPHILSPSIKRIILLLTHSTSSSAAKHFILQLVGQLFAIILLHKLCKYHGVYIGYLLVRLFRLGILI